MTNKTLIGAALLVGVLTCGQSTAADRMAHEYHQTAKLAEKARDHGQATQRPTSGVDARGLGADTYFLCGLAQEKLGDDREAIRNYTTAIRINPNMETACNNRGGAHYRLGEYVTAIKDFTRAIEINPSYALAYYNRGNAYYGKGDLDGAIEDFTRAIQMNPKNSAAYNNRGRALLQKQQRAASIRDFDRALKISPEYTLAIHNRDVARSPIGDPEDWKSEGDPRTTSAVLSFLKDWKSAWERKDFDRYTKLYSTDLQQGNMDYRKFVKAKRNFFQKYRTIRVETEHVDVKQGKDRIAVRFQQVFQGDDYRDKGWKSMVLARDKGKGFRIIQEDWFPEQVVSRNFGM
jgi:tetratricopeptide (TPR) repeat protein